MAAAVKAAEGMYLLQSCRRRTIYCAAQEDEYLDRLVGPTLMRLEVYVGVGHFGVTLDELNTEDSRQRYLCVSSVASGSVAQQQLPELTAGAFLHSVNGRMVRSIPTSQVISMLQQRPLLLDFAWKTKDLESNPVAQRWHSAASRSRRRGPRKPLSFQSHDEKGVAVKFTDAPVTSPRTRPKRTTADGSRLQGLLFQPPARQRGHNDTLAPALCEEPRTPWPSETALERQLFAAVDSADVKRVQQLVAAGVNIHSSDDEMGWAAIHHAVVNLQEQPVEIRTQMVSALLALDANADQEDLYHMTAVHMAAEEGCLETARLLTYASRNRRHSVEYLAGRHGFHDIAQMVSTRWEMAVATRGLGSPNDGEDTGFAGRKSERRPGH